MLTERQWNPTSEHSAPNCNTHSMRQPLSSGMCKAAVSEHAPSLAEFITSSNKVPTECTKHECQEISKPFHPTKGHKGMMQVVITPACIVLMAPAVPGSLGTMTAGTRKCTIMLAHTRNADIEFNDE